MNRSFKHLSLSIALSLLFVSAHTHCMHAKKLAKISTFHSLNTIKPVNRKCSYHPYLCSFKSPEKAAKALTSQYDHSRDSALYFFTERIKKKQDLALIAHIAEQTFTAPENPLTLGKTRQAALQIITALAEQDYIHDTALQFAATGMLTKSLLHVRLAGRNLFEALLQKDHPQTVEVAIQAAIDVFSEQDWTTIYDGLQLFNIMFSHGKGFKQATQFAERISQHKDWELRKSALQLLQALVEHDQAIALSEQIAMQQIKDFAVPSVQAQAFLLLIGLVKKNYAIESAKQAITFVSSSNQCLEDNPLWYYGELKLLCSEKTEQQKVIFGPLKDFVPSTELRFRPLEDLDFTRATKHDFPPRPAQPWSYPGEEREISISGARYGIRELGKRHKAIIETYGDKVDDSEIAAERTPQQKIKFGPLKDFVPSTELRLSGKKAEPWSGDGKIDEMSVDDFLYGLKELEKRHKHFIETYEPKHIPTKQHNIDTCSENIPLHRASDGDFDVPKHTSAWKELDIDVCSYDIPIARPDDGKPSDPKYTLLPGEEIKLTKAMCDLMRGNREAGLTPFEDDQHQYRTNDESINISPSHCTSKALMCIANPEQPQKKKRLLRDELKYSDGQPMGGDKLAYSLDVAELAAGLPELEAQHRANVDKCDKE